MPTFFFNVRDDLGPNPDETGLELPDTEAAVAEGRKALAEMAGDAITERTSSTLIMDIRDEQGDVVATLVFGSATLRDPERPKPVE